MCSFGRGSSASKVVSGNVGVAAGDTAPSTTKKQTAGAGNVEAAINDGSTTATDVSLAKQGAAPIATTKRLLHVPHLSILVMQIA